MLKQITFENWKSFRQAVLYIDPLTVLIGTNASGKSNALDGFVLLNRIALGRDISSSLAGDPTLSGIRGGIEWSTLRPADSFTIKVTVQERESDIEYVYSITIETDQRVQITSESLTRFIYAKGRREPYRIDLFQTDQVGQDNPSINTRMYNGKGGKKQEFRRSNSILSQMSGMNLRKEISEGVEVVLRALENIFILDPIPSNMRSFSAFSESLQSDASNIAGVLAALPENDKEVIEYTISKYISSLPERDIRKVWAEPVGRFQADAMLYCEEEWYPNKDPFTIDARGMSDGTLRFLAILTALLTRPQGSQLVIEEVDNGLHPSRAKLLLNMLKDVGSQRNIDILVTTHNPALLDALGPDMVPYIIVAHRDSETGESKLLLLEDVNNLPKLMASGPLGKIISQGSIERSINMESK